MCDCRIFARRTSAERQIRLRGVRTVLSDEARPKGRGLPQEMGRLFVRQKKSLDKIEYIED